MLTNLILVILKFSLPLVCCKLVGPSYLFITTLLSEMAIVHEKVDLN